MKPTTWARRHTKSDVDSQPPPWSRTGTLSSGSGRPHCQNHQRARLSPGEADPGRARSATCMRSWWCRRPTRAAAITRRSSGVVMLRRSSTSAAARSCGCDQRPARSSQVSSGDVARRPRTSTRLRVSRPLWWTQPRRSTRGRQRSRITWSASSGPGHGLGVGSWCRRAAVRWLKVTSSGSADAKLRACASSSTSLVARRRTPRVGDTSSGLRRRPRETESSRARATVKAPSASSTGSGVRAAIRRHCRVGARPHTAPFDLWTTAGASAPCG